MLIRRSHVMLPVTALLVLSAFSGLGWAAGDKVVPQVADGTGPDGTQFRTRFDITNLGPYESTRINRTVKLMFFRQGGTPWPIALRGRGVVTEVALELSAYQTVRIETDGASPQLTSGYAIVRNMETQASVFAEDYEVGVTVYYEVSKQGGVIDTVSVPIGQPTFVFMLPVQNAELQNLFSGLAMVNLGNFSNEITLELYPETPRRDSEGKAVPDQTILLPMGPNEQITRFLVDPTLFPDYRTYKGVLRGWALGPVALLALLQTPFSGGVQYATLVPAYIDALRRNTYMYLQEGFPLDADLPVVDYFNNDSDKDPWDLLYRRISGTQRELLAQEGATLAVIGSRNDTQFNLLDITTLQGLNYTSNPIDLRNGSANLASGFTFAIKTGLGRYVKVRIAGLIEFNIGPGDTEYDLHLQLYVYK